MTFIKAQEETLLNRLTNDYELNLFNIFGNTPSNADANMLVLGVLTKLTTVIEPGMMRNISEYVSKNGVSNTIKKLFNSKNYSNTLRDILGNSFSRTTHLERGVNPSYQCNKYLDSKLEDKCWICGGRCKDNPKLSIETNSSPKTKKRKRGGSKAGEGRVAAVETALLLSLLHGRARDRGRRAGRRLRTPLAKRYGGI